MSAELISAVSRSCSPLRVLADGDLYYVPIGEVEVTGALVTCHMCTRSLRSVTAHRRVHGWTKLACCEAFGLERGQSLEDLETHKLRAWSMGGMQLGATVTRTVRRVMCHGGPSQAFG
jgi:hypothetical protein